MHFRNRKLLILFALSILLAISLIPTSIGQSTNQQISNYQAQYSVLGHKLYVSLTPSLYEYYGNLTHTVNDDSDYANFVTPQAVLPIAQCLRNLTDGLSHSDEQFANAVLSLVHQIPYNVSNVQYPVETIVDNSGDCVPLSLLAASIMEAGGLDVILIHYTGINPAHMNVGVYLPYTPIYHSLLMAPTSFSYDNKTYWTAEATPLADWKVGDQSEDLIGATPVIIPLNNTITGLSPWQVSASLDNPLPPSSITLNLSQGNFTDEENLTRTLNITGSITPQYSGQPIVIYMNNESLSYNFTIFTDDNGMYSVPWNFTTAGTYYISASWSGTPDCSSADSETLAVFIGPPAQQQFQTPEYSYVLEQSNINYYSIGVNTVNQLLKPLLGLNDYLSLPLQENISLSYDFMVQPAGQTIVTAPSKTVSIPESQISISSIGRRHSIKLVQLPAENITVPTVVPQAWSLLHYLTNLTKQ